MAVGQISGPLLKSNLIRNGIDLAFDTDLLYLDVNDRKIGIKTNTPTHALTINGTTKTTDIEVTNQIKIGDDTNFLTISNNEIVSSAERIDIVPAGSNPVVYNSTLQIGGMTITNNTIEANTADTDLSFNPSGTGEVNVNSNLEIFGDLHITGIITATGTINSENATLAGGVAGDLLPTVTDTYSIGQPEKRWNTAYINTINADSINTASLTVGGIDLTQRPGNTIYVSTIGDNANSGTHQNDPYGSLKYALTQATYGTTIVVYPGIYTEIFPMTVPAGVTVRGAGIRSVVVRPTLSSNDKDAFLLNGDVTIEDLTVSDFFYNSTNNTGHAFRFASGMTVAAKSPYIRNISVITKGSVTSPSDPLGFDQGDAGRGGLFDGSVVSPSSKEAAILFNAATFITPGAEAITLTNGVRVEWLNSFTYYANRGLRALTGTTGFANAGKTAIRVSSTTGTFEVGQTLTSYATDGTTILAQGVISNITDNKIHLTGKVDGLVSKVDAAGKTVTAFGDAKLTTAVKRFGTASLALDGTDDYVFVQSSPDFAYGTGEFTVEGWFYRSTSPGTVQVLFDYRTANPQVVAAIYLTNTYVPSLNVDGVVHITGGPAIPLNSWTHIALSRSGTSTKLFVNGVQSGNTYNDSNNYIQGPLTIGARFDGTSGFHGYIDEVRISKGIAKYTNTFAVPTSEFVKTADTVLLLHFNGPDESNVIEDDSFVIQDVRTATGSARYIEMVDYTDFGAEVRAMSSANVYGNYGVTGDGPGVVMYLIGHNFAYIGSGKDSSNDLGTVIQLNEVVKTNGAYIYFNSMDQRGDFRVGDLFYVNQETGQVQFTSANFNISSTTGLTLSDGTNTTTVEAAKLETGDIRISGNTIETLTLPLNIVSAGDQINLLNNVEITGNLNVDGNLTIGGNIVIGDQPSDTISFVAGITSDLIPNGNYNLGSSVDRWANVYTTSLYVDSLEISGTTVQSTEFNSPLTLAATGSSFIKFEDFEVQDNELRSSTDQNLVLKPNGQGVVYIDSTQSLRLPSGTSDQRGAVVGGIRYNTQTTHFEGFDGTTWVILDGVYDSDLNTYITAELTPGANDNVIRFYSDGALVADINSTRLSTSRIEVGSLVIENNAISTAETNTDISLQATGTGSVKVENFAFRDNVITPTTANSVLTFQQSGDGYFKFDGTGGLVIPFGLSPERPINAEIGMIRYNTSDKRVEVYNGSTWINSAGESTANVTVGEAEDLAIQYVLTLG
jgi:hypothetical protein